MGQQAAGLSNYSIMRIGKDVKLVRDGLKSWDRLVMNEAAPQTASYIASDEALRSTNDLLAMGKSSLEKRVKKYSHDHLRVREN